METIQVPQYALDGRQLLATLRSNITEKLSTFCRNHLQRIKYVTGSFSTTLDLRSSVSTRSRSLSRLAKILYRNAVKANPALSYALSVSSSGVFSANNNGFSLTFHVYGEVMERSIPRYVRYLNYQLMKEGIPLLVREPSFIGKTSNTPAHVTVNVEMTVRYPSELHPRSSQESLEDWVRQQREALTTENKDPDGVFSATMADRWSWISLNGLLAELSTMQSRPSGHLGMYKLACPERIVLHAPKIVQVINTISRKFAYATNAFSVTAAGDAGG